jgi:hypothetical protein
MPTLRPLRVYNAGSTTELGAFRRFTFQDGRLQQAPKWIHANASPESTRSARCAAGAAARVTLRR